jgi:phospholipid/cholesterol/gamma-HCH transport system substrate-binding protein
MAHKPSNTIKLGLFVLAGLAFLIFTLYMIGANRNLFGSSFVLRAQFENVNGLTPGNNVRFAGIEVGTVKKVRLVSDTLIEVTMAIDREMKEVLRSNALVSIGTEGIIGNKVVNIIAVKEPAPPVQEGDMLRARHDVDPDAMLRTLERTNNNIADLVDDLRVTVHRVSTSTELFNLLNDKKLSEDIRGALANLHRTSELASHTMGDLHATLGGVRDGKGTVGQLLTDTTIVYELEQAVRHIRIIEANVDSLTGELNQMVGRIDRNVEEGPGLLHTVMKDSLLAERLNSSVANIEKGTASFNQNMEALKSNFLFRGYFRKQERKKQKALKQ